MKPLLTLLVMMLLSIGLFSQETEKQIYKIDNLDATLMKHKTVAILPFDITITYKRPPKDYDEAANKQEEKSLSLNLQSEMFTYLLRKKNDYTVSFQDVDRTNALLKKDSNFYKLDELTADSIAKILQVDAIIKCGYSYVKTSTEGAAIAKTILFGGIGSKTASGQLVMQIKNSSTGELLWRFSKKMDETAFSSANQLMERMMKKVSRNFPYEK